MDVSRDEIEITSYMKINQYGYPILISLNSRRLIVYALIVLIYKKLLHMYISCFKIVSTCGLSTMFDTRGVYNEVRYCSVEDENIIHSLLLYDRMCVRYRGIVLSKYR